MPAPALRSDPTRRSVPLNRSIAEHLTSLEARAYAPSTIRCRRGYLRHFSGWCRYHSLDDPARISLQHLEQYRLALTRLRRTDGDPLGRGAHVQRLLALKSFFRWCVRRELLHKDPTVELDLPRREQTLPQAVLTAPEIERVLAVPDLATACGIRDRAILETFYSSGIRRTELVRLKSTDVDNDQRLLWVRQGKGGRDRVVPAGARALRWIERYARDVRPKWVSGPDNTVLFLTNRGRSLHHSRLSERVAHYVDQAKLGKRGSCHLFRHSMATLMLEGGADIRWIQAMLGHAQLSTTALYTRVAISQLKRVHEQTHPAGR